MFIQVLRQVMVAGEPASVGSILDLPPATALLLINSGKAIQAPEEAEPAPAPAVEPEPIKPARTRTKPSPTPIED
jgi:hypothetical protein